MEKFVKKWWNFGHVLGVFIGTSLFFFNLFFLKKYFYGEYMNIYFNV